MYRLGEEHRVLLPKEVRRPYMLEINKDAVVASKRIESGEVEAANLLDS